MSKCSSYHKISKLQTPYSLYPEIQCVCYGTKNRERCTCGGDTTKCNFYPEKRGSSMRTAEMVIAANENDKTYRSIGGDMRYNNNKGFHNIYGSQWQGSAFRFVNDVFDIKWEEAPENEMTVKEAEEKFGIKIIG